MPAKSGKQYRLMQFIKHGGKVKDGPSKSVAAEFIRKTPKTLREAYSKSK